MRGIYRKGNLDDPRFSTKFRVKLDNDFGRNA